MCGALAALGDLREFLHAAHPEFPEVFVLEKRPRRNDAKAGPVKTNNGYGQGNRVKKSCGD
jgi:hypothetical protein